MAKPFAFHVAFPPSGSGGLDSRPVDSLLFSATVHPSAAEKSDWAADIQLQNGARVVLSLDAKAERGELRSVADRYNLQVLSAFMGLGVEHAR
jgi:hypothetical protein